MGALIAWLATRLGIGSALASVIMWAVLALAVSGAVWGGYELIKHRGAEEVRTQIQKENADAIVKGIEAGRSFDGCVAAGGVYDFRRQRCAGVAPDPR